MRTTHVVLVVAAAFASAFWLGRITGPPAPASVDDPGRDAAAGKAPAKAKDKRPGAKAKKASRYDGTVKRANEAAYLAADDPAVGVEALPPRTLQIVDVHEHAQDRQQAERLLPYMDRLGIRLMCLQAASIYTYTLDDRYGFERFKENNEELLRTKAAHPDRFCAFVTIHPEDQGNVALLEDYVRRGADGLKLFLGHGAGTGKGKFHMMSLDDPRMMPVYALAERTQLPIMFHINFINYFEEFVRVMEAHPYLRVCVPHFGLHKNTAKRLARLSWLFERYPNFYVDQSYGHHTFHKEGFETLSRSRDRTLAFMTRHADRILFGSDMVMERRKQDAYIEETLRSYLQWNEMDAFRFHMVPDRLMKGMKLPEAALRAIYVEAPARFLLLGPDGRPPDRSKGWPPTPTPGLPPTVPAVTALAPTDPIPGQ